MLYPFMTLNDNTEIVHSETLENSGKEEVEVRIEKPIEGGFYSATCWLPEYRWENIQGFSQEDIHYFQELLESVAHIFCNWQEKAESKYQKSLKIRIK